VCPAGKATFALSVLADGNGACQWYWVCQQGVIIGPNIFWLAYYVALLPFVLIINCLASLFACVADFHQLFFQVR